MNLQPQVKQMIQVGARHADGITSLWHVNAESHIQAAALVSQDILQVKPFQPAGVVLACIPGGKS